MLSLIKCDLHIMDANVCIFLWREAILLTLDTHNPLLWTFDLYKNAYRKELNVPLISALGHLPFPNFPRISFTNVFSISLFSP